MSELQIASGRVVGLRYSLRDTSQNLLDETPADQTFYYLHGYRNIVPGLEAALEGKTAGAKVDTTLPPEQGYGPRQKSKAQPFPRSSFPKEAKIGRDMRVMVKNPQGQLVPLWVTKVQGPTVYLDPNHPLAGMTLSFSVEVISVRDAVKGELDHGHPHGADGHAGHEPEPTPAADATEATP